jgi:hypothetical protein
MTTEVQQPHEKISNHRDLCSTKSPTAKKTKGEVITHWQVPVLEAQVQQTANAPCLCALRPPHTHLMWSEVLRPHGYEVALSTHDNI